jgi:hypothetical protein
MGVSWDNADRWLTSRELVALANDAGYAALRTRTLEEFRQHGLLPRVKRLSRDGKAVWAHPPGTARQLLALLQLRDSTKNTDMLRVGLWYHGFLVSLDRVRETMSSRLEEFGHTLMSELAGDGESLDEERIAQLAGKAAGRRGERSIGPRTARMSVQERTLGIAYLFRLLCGAPETARPDDPRHLERVMGLDAARHGLGPDHTWITTFPGEEARALAPSLDLNAWIHNTNSASDDELEHARDQCRQLLTGLPIVALMLEAAVGRSAAGLGALAKPVTVEPDMIPFLIAFLVTLTRTHADGLAEISHALKPVDEALPDFKRFAALEPSGQERQLERLPRDDAQRLRRATRLYNERLARH